MKNRLFVTSGVLAFVVLACPVVGYGATATLLPAYQKQIAEDAIHRKDWNAAAHDLLDAISVDYHDAVAHSELGSVYLQLGEPDRAGEEFRVALHLHPHLTSAEDGLDQSFQTQSQRDAYFEQVKQQIALDPNNANERTTLAELYLDRDEVDNAEVQAHAALQVAPRLGHAHCVMGRIEVSRHQGDMAKADFEMAVKWDRNDDDAWAGLGDLAMARHDLAEALACYRHSVQAAPDHAEWHSKLAEALTANGDAGGAARENARAAELNAPKSPSAG